MVSSGLRQIGAVLMGMAMLVGIGCSHLSAPTGDGATSAHTLSGGQPIGPLKITRIEVVFPNNRGDMTVPLRAPLIATATVRFNGNGLFRAVWRVDGRDLESVNLTITHGDTLRLSMDQATLPTFEPGRHRVTLRVLAPSTAPPDPKASYFVTP